MNIPFLQLGQLRVHAYREFGEEGLKFSRKNPQHAALSGEYPFFDIERVNPVLAGRTQSWINNLKLSKNMSAPPARIFSAPPARKNIEFLKYIKVCKRFLRLFHFHFTSFFRFIVANLSITQFDTSARSVYGVYRMACFSFASANTLYFFFSHPSAAQFRQYLFSNITLTEPGGTREFYR